jgi:GNAT superfamily N-acetyltransferase
VRLNTLQEPTTRASICVTFLRMEQPPTSPSRPLPADCGVSRVERPTVSFYRYLYNTVGEAHLWWLRRMASDAELAGLLGDPRLSLDVLYRGGAPAGFYELDRRPAPDFNLSYFGLLPHAVGLGLGTGFLRHAVDTAWAEGAGAITVNTCTADNPRALPGYRRMGFRPMRDVREVWNIPCRLGMVIPPHLRGP